MMNRVIAFRSPFKKKLLPFKFGFLYNEPISGLKRLEELALRGGIINTFLAAYERAKTLS